MPSNHRILDISMSYGYMIFATKPSALLIKNRSLHFRQMINHAGYRVYCSMHEEKTGIINREMEKCTVSIDGDALFSDLYSEIGSFFFMYFLLHNREGEDNAAKKMHSFITNNKIVRYDFDRDLSICINVPYLIYRGQHE